MLTQICWLVQLAAITGWLLITADVPAQADEVGDYLLWQTNAGGDDIHVYDTGSAELVRRIIVGPNPHGIAWPVDGTHVYVSLERDGESNGELLWINRQTFEIEHRLDVGPEPHAIAVTPDGRWVYVPCRDGTYWIVDTELRSVVKTIHTGGRPHNTTPSPDGTRVYLSPMGAPRAVTSVDPNDGHKVVGEIQFSASVRPPAIAPSRNLFFQHIDGLNGFEVADLTRNEVIARVEHSAGLGLPVYPRLLGFLSLTGLSRCHGLAVRPGDNEVWSVCGQNMTIHTINNRDMQEIAHITLPAKGYWLTFSPNGKTAFVALSSASEVAVIDADLRQLVETVVAGASPKRNLVVPR